MLYLSLIGVVMLQKLVLNENELDKMIHDLRIRFAFRAMFPGDDRTREIKDFSMLVDLDPKIMGHSISFGATNN
jgi:hypothetical protein